ncbi:MAG: transcriptional repressor [Clostridiales bacterium]|nr:transcriptional repressor [Clostridiales bacterium]
MTKYEKSIYNMVAVHHEHLTANRIYERLKEEYPKVVRATVYNNLNKLWEMGSIQKVCIEGMPDRYDSVHKHDHLVCHKCGKLTDVSFEDLTAPIRSHLGEDFLSYDLKVYYLCPKCRTKKEQI